MKMKIAVWGATGHVGKAVTTEFAKRKGLVLDVFVRNTAKAEEFLSREHISNISAYDIKEFNAAGYDAVINCTGIGNPGVLAQYSERVFQITEEFDSLLISSAQQNPKCVFINFSSGAVYGTEFYEPATAQTAVSFSPNDITPNRFYGLAKLNSEGKHRAYPNLPIIDLRMFAFFSRFIDWDAPFFMSELCQSIIHKTIFRTSQDDFVRDFIHPADLSEMLIRCIEKGGNTVYDLYSQAPVTKWEIIRCCAENFGLQYTIDEVKLSPTGAKSNYYSLHHKVEEIGYRPRYTSLEGLSAIIRSIVAEGDRTI